MHNSTADHPHQQPLRQQHLHQGILLQQHQQRPGIPQGTLFLQTLLRQGTHQGILLQTLHSLQRQVLLLLPHPAAVG
jgi:hypothetical protein